MPSMNYISTEITSNFSGMNNIIIDGNGLIHYIIDTFNLNLQNIPSETFINYIDFLIENTVALNFKIFFMQPSSLEEEVIIKQIICKFKNIIIIENVEREIFKSPLLISYKNDDMIKYYNKKGICTATLNEIEFNYPHIFVFIYKNNENEILESEVEEHYENIEKYIYSGGNIKEINEEDKNKILEIYKKINNGNSEDKLFCYNFIMKNKVDEKKYKLKREIIKIINGLIEDGIIIDGRIILYCAVSNGLIEFYDEIMKNMGVEDWMASETDISESKMVDEWVESDDLVEKVSDIKLDNSNDSNIFKIGESTRDCMELVIQRKDKQKNDKGKQIYSQNLKKRAMSLFDNELLYRPITRQSKTKMKYSKKQLKIIEMNEEIQRKKETERDRLNLISFYNKYKEMSREGKKEALKKIHSKSIMVQVNILLLKIEFYYDEWALEKRKQKIDESVLIPCYLSILKYLDVYSKNKKACKKREVVYVFQKLIDCGFESTAREILLQEDFKKEKILEELKFEKNGSEKPNDLDIYFQMKYAGDKLKRNLNSRPDPRVLFEPDEWQINLLDIVDKNMSAVISTPTSSGKTFICFYAIEKVLRESDKDVVVFCLPTKALANQVSADVYARFNSKIYSKNDMTLQGILMRDYQISEQNSQVLITVPLMLEALLLTNPKNIKYIIIDEMHEISNEEMGSYIERIVHLAPCPLLVLSATLGNLDYFYSWIKNIENSKGRECKLIHHNERYCELKNYLYNNKINEINPLFSFDIEDIIEKYKKDEDGINPLGFLPADVLQLYYTLFSVLTKDQKHIIKKLRPKNFFKSNVINRLDVKNYEKFLIENLNYYIKSKEIDLEQVREFYNSLTEESFNVSKNIDTDIYKQILPLLNILKTEEKTPCLVFNMERDICNKLALSVYTELEYMDNKQSDKTKKKDKILKELKRARDEKKKEKDWIEESIKNEENLEALREEKKSIEYCFINPLEKVSDYELEEQIKMLKKNISDHRFLDMLYRGIGVHHNGMHKKYRELVEILFRKKHLNVVFTTETLSLGINMPCRSVIFAGDNVRLNPMNFRQMAGRAGRRGFDTIGNVIFLGISVNKIKNLLSSNIPDIQGNYSFINSNLLNTKKEFYESLVKYPLVQTEKSLVEKQIKKLIEDNFILEIKNEGNIAGDDNECDTFCLKDYNLGCLSDPVISNRENDPNMFILMQMLKKGIINAEWISPYDFIEILSNFFAVKKTLNKEVSLPTLRYEIEEFINGINNIYFEEVKEQYNSRCKNLSDECGYPLLRINSFYNFNKGLKNDYILKYFSSGKREKVYTENDISEGELWNGCNTIYNILKSLVDMFDYYEMDKGAKKNIAYIMEMFKNKFDLLHA
ncbi:DEAD/DEAH box helicase [Spraguea lophii 42_110]|uniref:DEAD/DEAH box helicase n=1 Tax=Spraguea lophii (strain 42_110) TaxID=1358809 RepID=S7W7G8_SPRLO|nr:DEAD/DEAH box helicase [Spraguea lophii 42_110]